jgi:hypothetical protein
MFKGDRREKIFSMMNELNILFYKTYEFLLFLENRNKFEFYI